MKRLSQLFVVLLLFSVCSYGQTDQTTTGITKNNDDHPVMSFETTEIDYGVIQQNADPYREFHFTNTGNLPLIITKAKGSCGCTVPEYPKEPIAPGGSNVIKVRYATSRIGKFSKSITLTTNEPEGTHILKIKGEVLSNPVSPSAVPASTTSGEDQN